MEQNKVLPIILLGLKLVTTCLATCTESEIDVCVTDYETDLGSAGITFEFPVPNIASNQLTDLCTGKTAFTTCLNGHRADCSFIRKNDYQPMEDISKFICDDTATYESQQSDISNSATRLVWNGCFTAGAVNVFNDNPTTDTTLGCNTLKTFITCMGAAAKAGGGSDLEAYISDMARQALTVYDDHYGCGIGSAGRIAGMTSLQILCLIILAWAWM